MTETGAILAMAAILLVTFAVLRTITVISNRRAARRRDAATEPQAGKRSRKDKRKSKRKLKGLSKALDASRKESAASPSHRDEVPPLHRTGQSNRAPSSETPLAAPSRTGTAAQSQAQTPPLHAPRLATRSAPVHSPSLHARPATEHKTEPTLSTAPQGKSAEPKAPAGFVEPEPVRRLVQRVFFGTDRASSGQSDAGPTFGDDRGEGLTLGHADILLPAVATRIDGSHASTEAGLITVSRPGDETADDRSFELQRVTHLAAQSFVNGAGMQARTARHFPGAALVYLHGLHTDFPGALFRTAQIAHDLGFDGPAYAFCWPSNSEQADPTGDRARAEDSIDALDLFLETILATPGVKQVHLVAHSTGVAPLAQLLSHHSTRIAAHSSRPFGQLVLAAPDMETADLESYVPHLTRMSQGVTLYASASDSALRATHDANGATALAGDVPDSGPMIAEGIDTIDASAPGTGVLGLSRNEYLAERDILADIAALLATGTRPPHQRGENLREVPTPQGSYWRIQG